MQAGRRRYIKWWGELDSREKRGEKMKRERDKRRVREGKERVLEQREGKERVLEHYK